LLVHRKTAWWNPSTYIAKRIQAASKSKWNHIGILAFVEYQGEKQWCVVEALFRGGVTVRPLSWYQDRKKDYEIAFGQVSIACAMRAHGAARWAVEQVGSPYDFAKIFRIRALQLIGGLGSIGGLEVLDYVPKNSYICSGLFLRAYKHVERPIGGLGPYASPADIAPH
jgi:hypothetical protein